MTMIYYQGGTKFNKFYLKDLFTDELIECSEEEFDSIITKHRDLYEMEYDGVNRQIFKHDGVIEGARER